ncbi:MAG: hypothetical protein HYU86_00980 [Chloroflexi bacterium]|nr:hypothetical protein [Chloroflexota bacterium]
MAKFIGLHSPPGFTREMLEMAQQDAFQTLNIQLLATHYDSSTGRVICQVEARLIGKASLPGLTG